MLFASYFKDSRIISFFSISTNHTLSIGGIESTDLIRRFARYLSAIDFIGCMRNIVIINATMTKSDFIASNGVRAGCRRTKGCDSNSCGVGQCIDLWSEVECRCKDGYTAKSCQKGELLFDVDVFSQEILFLIEFTRLLPLLLLSHFESRNRFYIGSNKKKMTFNFSVSLIPTSKPHVASVVSLVLVL